MSQYRKKPVVITAITWAELIAHGIAQCQQEGRESNIVNGMPWSFQYAGKPITHEDDTCYLIPTPEGTMRMTPSDMLITGVKGEIYPCKVYIFEATYEPAGPEIETKAYADGHVATGPAPLPSVSPDGAPELAPHQQRVVLELDELNSKLGRLHSFFSTDKFKELADDEAKRLYRQAEHMVSYAEVLGERVAAFIN